MCEFSVWPPGHKNKTWCGKRSLSSKTKYMCSSSTRVCVCVLRSWLCVCVCVCGGGGIMKYLEHVFCADRFCLNTSAVCRVFLSGCAFELLSRCSRTPPHSITSSDCDISIRMFGWEHSDRIFVTSKAVCNPRWMLTRAWRRRRLLRAVVLNLETPGRLMKRGSVRNASVGRVE